MHISVSKIGAELQSIVANGRQYLWQGDPEFWGRRAPILFPIVGKLADDKLRINGHEYTMKQHGFARDTEFVEQDGWYVIARRNDEAFGLWAPNKPGCPFVCIEPWCGIADNAGFKGDISERDCIHSLEPGKNFEFCYSITLNS